MKKWVALAALLLALLAFASCAKKQGGMNYKEVVEITAENARRFYRL